MNWNQSWYWYWDLESPTSFLYNISDFLFFLSRTICSSLVTTRFPQKRQGPEPSWASFLVVFIFLLFSPLTNILVYFFSLFIDSKFHNNLTISCRSESSNI